MRTNIVIDDKLMAAAMEAGGFKTKKDAVEEGLKLLARRKAYRDLSALRGKLHWTGDDDSDWREPEAAGAAPAVHAVHEAGAAYAVTVKAKARAAKSTQPAKSGKKP